MASKRIRPNDGNQDFGFLAPTSERETETAAADSLNVDSNPGPVDVGSKAVDSNSNDAVSDFAISSDPPEISSTPALVESGETLCSEVGSSANTDVPQNDSSVENTANADLPNAPLADLPNAPLADLPNAPLAELPNAPVADSSKLLVGVIGYAIALTLLFLGLLATGHISLFGNPTLESLPDIRPLAPNEFRKVPDGVELPDGHVLRIGEVRRFGDVVVTPVKVTREPLKFQGFLTGKVNESLTTEPVLKLWLKFENVADGYAYPPFDSDLMSNRTPPFSTDAATHANSFLTIITASDPLAKVRKLNFLHTMENNFVIVGQESARVLQPGESLLTFIAASNEDDEVTTDEATQFAWRIQIRKGVNQSSGHGVTTLIDVKFSGSEVDAGEVSAG